MASKIQQFLCVNTFPSKADNVCCAPPQVECHGLLRRVALNFLTELNNQLYIGTSVNDITMNQK
ncbi:hypothetical protein BpHYR1_050094 [Brachionus plicatilis]|uniref:Uncharacterized protein n=1 Tax=Brachionus plicatilis TaxID=10195 RepID=A0A3M7PLF4_BRAPC|nr:hypothetical protein BpHYR1_050094 [Brachionus plicatilis]